MAKLVYASGPSEGREVRLTDFQIVGRLPGNGVPIPEDAGASRRHTRVFKSKGVFIALDLESKNGTLLNGERVTRAELKDGDVLTVGTTMFRFVAEPEDLFVAAPTSNVAGGGDDVVRAGKRGVDEKALIFSDTGRSSGETLGWLRGDLAQRPFLYRALLWIGAGLIAAGLFYWSYRAAASA
jgi:hypothetical protein